MDAPYWKEFDRLQERAFWQHKIRAEATNSTAAIARLEGDLWRYYEERSSVAAPFKEAVRHEGLHRTSMRNLVELLLGCNVPA